MKNLLLAVPLFILVGCGTSMPTQKTGNLNEYVINRDDKSMFGSLPAVKRAVAAEAISFCAAMNKKYVEKYSIDKERAVMVWPESTLYYECVDEGKIQGSAMSQTKKDGATQSSDAVYSDLIRLDELRKKGILTDAEFDAEKKKLLIGK